MACSNQLNSKKMESIGFRYRGTSDGIIKNQSVLCTTRSYLDYLLNFKPALEKEREEIETRRKKRELESLNSKMLTKEWPNTQENVRKTLHAQNIQRKRSYEQTGEKLLREAEIASETASKQIIEETKHLQFEENHKVKQFHGAIILSEVLGERMSQIKLNEKLKILKKERKNFFTNSVKANADLYVEEVKKQKEKNKSCMLKYREFLNHQVNERHREMEERMKENCINDQNFFEILPRINTGDSVVKRKKMQSLAQSLRDDFLEREFIRHERERDEKLDDQYIQVYKEAEEKFTKALRSKNEQHLRDSLAVKKEVQDKIEYIMKKLMKDTEAKEKEILEMSHKELKKREEKIFNTIKKINQKTIAEFMSANNIIIKKNEEKKDLLAQVRHLQMLQRIKLADHEKKYAENKYLAKKRKQAETRAFYKAQTDAQLTIQQREKENEANFLKNVIKYQKIEEDNLRAYTTNLIEQYKSKGKDIRPLQKAAKALCPTNMN